MFTRLTLLAHQQPQASRLAVPTATRTITQSRSFTRRHTTSTSAPLNNAPKYFALFYKYKYQGDELTQKSSDIPRAPHRAEHLKLATETEELKMGGAWGDLSGALIVFYGSKESVENFARNDPYTKNGIVESWECKEWAMVATKYDIPTVKI